MKPTAEEAREALRMIVYRMSDAAARASDADIIKLSEFLIAAQPAEPGEFVTVPREPTKTMVSAWRCPDDPGGDEIIEIGEQFRRRYTAMIAAAPPTPSSEASGKGEDAALREAREDEREACARLIQPAGPRPCDCTTCYCGNYGDAAAVADWDAATSAAASIRARAVTREPIDAARSATGREG